MKTIILTLFTAACSLACNAQNATINKSADRIDGVKVSSIYKVRVVKGNTSSVSVQVPERYQENVSITFDKGTVNLSSKGDIRMNHGETMIAQIVCPQLNSIEASAASSVVVESEFDVAELKIEASGASNISYKVPQRISRKCAIDASSASKIEINLTTPVLEIDGSSAANVTINGSANQLKVDASGATNIKCGQLNATTANVDASGAANVLVNVSQSADFEASGASHITYSGNAQVRTDKASLSASIRKQ